MLTFCLGNALTGTRVAMDSQHNQEHYEQKDTRREQATRSAKLDERYGKIGIPAVAAAVRCRGEKQRSDRARYEPQDCD